MPHRSLRGQVSPGWRASSWCDGATDATGSLLPAHALSPPLPSPQTSNQAPAPAPPAPAPAQHQHRAASKLVPLLPLSRPAFHSAMVVKLMSAMTTLPPPPGSPGSAPANTMAHECSAPRPTIAAQSAPCGLIIASHRMSSAPAGAPPPGAATAQRPAGLACARCTATSRRAGWLAGWLAG